MTGLRLYAIGAAIVVALVGAMAVYTAIRAQGKAAGAAAERTKTQKENDDAGNRAEDWRGALERCRAAGRVFDFERGACR